MRRNVARVIGKWRDARISVRQDVFAVVSLAIVIGAAAVFYLSLRSPTPEDIAREWVEDNFIGVAGDGLVASYLTQTNFWDTEGIERVIGKNPPHKTTWSYGPVVYLVADWYEVTATASVRLHDEASAIEDGRYREAIKSATRTEASASQVGLSSFSEELTMSFHLTVDMVSRSVVDWHAHVEE